MPTVVDASIRVVRRAGPRKIRRLWRVACSPASSFGVHNNTTDNLIRAATERVLNEQVDGEWVPLRTPQPITFEYHLGVFAMRMDALAHSTTPVTRQTIVEQYKGRKRVNYQAAADSLTASDVRPSDAYLKTFIKCEKIDFFVKADPAPRVIQPRSPRYNLSLAVYLKPLEHTIYENINKLFGYTTVMKGLNAVDQAKAIRESWDSIADPVAVDLDASRWDRHVSRTALRWEHQRYLAYYEGTNRERLAELLGWQGTERKNVCVGYLPDGKVKWKMWGRRASGDINTAVGNVLIMTACIWSWTREVGIDNFRLVNNGDDSVLIMPRRCVPLLATITEWFERMGFIMKVGEITNVFERIKFCQTQPVWDGSRWIMCRDPRTVLAKDAHSILPLDNETNVRGWLASVGDCGLSLAGNLPIFNEYYHWMRNQGDSNNRVGYDPSMETGMRWLAIGLSPHYAEPTEEARISFWKAFGFDGTDQRLWERYFAQLGGVKLGTPFLVPDGVRPEQTLYRGVGVTRAPRMRG